MRAKELLERYVRGECTPAERAMIERWYLEHAGEEQCPASPQKDPAVQRSENWSRLENDIDSYNRRKLGRKLLGAAASITLVFTIGLLSWQGWYPSRSDLPNPTLGAAEASRADIGPGGHRAQIRLSDGRTVELNEAHNGIVITDAGVQYDGGEWLLSQSDLRAPAGGTSKEVELIDISTPRGGQYNVTLPDGSKVWLNASSTLQYPVQFAVDQREVYLEGEAYFEVKSIVASNGKKRPFLVRSKGQTIQVFGTEFNVAAYPDEPNIRTTLVTGQIGVSNSSTNVFQMLTPGQQSVLQGDQLEVHEVDVAQFVAWKDGLLILKQADFATLLRQIERWYDVVFIIESSELPVTFSGEVPRSVNLSEILKTLELNTKVKFTMNGRRITMTD